MEDFNKEKLQIHITHQEDQTVLFFNGKSEFSKPKEIVEPYLKEISDQFETKKAYLDFLNLEYINSATMTIILGFIKSLSDREVMITILYNGHHWWQTALFSQTSAMGYNKNITLIKK